MQGTEIYNKYPKLVNRIILYSQLSNKPLNDQQHALNFFYVLHRFSLHDVNAQ